MICTGRKREWGKRKRAEERKREWGKVSERERERKKEWSKVGEEKTGKKLVVYGDMIGFRKRKKKFCRVINGHFSD